MRNRKTFISGSLFLILDGKQTWIVLYLFYILKKICELFQGIASLKLFLKCKVDKQPYIVEN